MISFELSQVIERPVDRVFLFLRDYSNMPLWNYYVLKVVKLSAGEIGTGTVFEQTRKHDMQRYKIAVYDQPNRLAIELLPPGPRHQLEFELKPVNGQTQLYYKWQVDLDNYKLLRFIPKGIFKKWILSFAKKQILTRTMAAVEQNFLKLKILLETGEVVLQDGRHTILPSSFDR
jgi:hypothetical protein